MMLNEPQFFKLEVTECEFPKCRNLARYGVRDAAGKFVGNSCEMHALKKPWGELIVKWRKRDTPPCMRKKKPC